MLSPYATSEGYRNIWASIYIRFSQILLKRKV